MAGAAGERELAGGGGRSGALTVPQLPDREAQGQYKGPQELAVVGAEVELPSVPPHPQVFFKDCIYSSSALHQYFDPAYPAGSYSLKMADPYDRCVSHVGTPRALVATGQVRQVAQMPKA
jgi:hypothetical protein